MKTWTPLLLIVLAGCTNVSSVPQSAAVPVYTFDDLRSGGGQSQEVVGSPAIVRTNIGTATRFDGESDGLVFAINPLEGSQEFTVEMLIRPDAAGPREQRFLHFQDDANARGLLELRMFENGWALDAFLFSSAGQLALFDATKLHPADRWTWVAMSYKDGVLTSFVNGEKELEGKVNFPVMGSGKTSVGMRQNRVSWFKGEIREVLFHRVSLGTGSLKSVGR